MKMTELCLWRRDPVWGLWKLPMGLAPRPPPTASAQGSLGSGAREPHPASPQGQLPSLMPGQGPRRIQQRRQGQCRRLAWPCPALPAGSRLQCTVQPPLSAHAVPQRHHQARPTSGGPHCRGSILPKVGASHKEPLTPARPRQTKATWPGDTDITSRPLCSQDGPQNLSPGPTEAGPPSSAPSQNAQCHPGR